MAGFDFARRVRRGDVFAGRRYLPKDIEPSCLVATDSNTGSRRSDSSSSSQFGDDRDDCDLAGRYHLVGLDSTNWSKGLFAQCWTTTVDVLIARCDNWIVDVFERTLPTYWRGLVWTASRECSLLELEAARGTSAKLGGGGRCRVDCWVDAVGFAQPKIFGRTSMADNAWWLHAAVGK